MFDFMSTSHKKPLHSRSQSQQIPKASTHRGWAGEEHGSRRDDLEEPNPFRPHRHPHSSAQTALAPPFRAHRSSQGQLPRPGPTDIPSESGSTHNSVPCPIDLHSRLSSAAQRRRRSSQESAPELLFDPWTNRQVSIGSPATPKSGTQRLKKRSSRLISEFFNGESKPIQIGPVPSPTKVNRDPMDGLTNRPSLASRFSLFGNKSPNSNRPPTPPQLHDEFIDLDIASALAISKDSSSTTSFKRLHTNAESLLSRMQAAYKERSIALRDIIAERDAETEEREGTDTRCQALKVQLDEMASRLKEQDDAMMDLVDQLADEKRQRREEEESRKRTVTLIRHGRRERLSTATTASTCESEDDSSGESVFSRAHGASSPCMSMSSVSVVSSPDAHQLPEFPPALTPQMARMQGGLASHPFTPAKGTAAIRRCQGAKDFEAWSVVSMLKEENAALKDRVSQMEGALDGCLDVVARLGG